jgi:S-adenosylmethionine:tRNA ribosyltransferase-isomerase
MQLSDFDYELPPQLIAQTPLEPRDSSKLLVLDRARGAITHRIFRDIGDYLRPHDVLVVNNTRVLPARLHAHKPSGGLVEVLLLRQQDPHRWHALIGGRRVTDGMTLTLHGDAALTIMVESKVDGPERIIRFNQPINPHLARLGEMPLPPYIHEKVGDAERYQTVYNREAGSAAAPTAGLHFTPQLLAQLQAQGVAVAHCTLHIGLDTFAPVKVDNIQEHKMHTERAALTAENAAIINAAKAQGGRVIAVGTTSARTLETGAILSAGGRPAEAHTLAPPSAWLPLAAFEHDTNLFIYPGYTWRAVEAMVTNFHLPKSTLLMMLSSLVGREALLAAYEEAKRQHYRFFSFGDAMLIL